MLLISGLLSQVSVAVLAASRSEAYTLTQVVQDVWSADVQDDTSGFAARFNSISSVNISELRIGNLPLTCANSKGDNISCGTLTSSPTSAPAEEEAAAATVSAAVGAAVGAAVAGPTATLLVSNDSDH